MKVKDFRVFDKNELPKGVCCYIYQPTDGMTDEELKEELEEYDEDICVIDGVFYMNCGDKKVRELPFEKWDTDTICEILGNLLEDNNRHNITGIGYTFKKMMEDANVDKESMRKTLVNLLAYYDATKSLKL